MTATMIPEASRIDQERREYVEAIWDLFCQKTGRERLMGSLEFALARHWFIHEYPLHAVVLRGIKDTKKAVGTLMYYQKAVEQAMERHLSPM